MSDAGGGLRRFFSETLWQYDGAKLGLVSRWLLRWVRVAVLVVRDFNRDNCLLRASALTFTTLLSIVPLLAFAFAILKGLGMQQRLELLLLEHISVGSEAVVGRIVEYINNTNVRRLGTVGLGVLLLTVMTLLSNIEESFNYLWGVKETRSLLRRFADYFSVLAFGPLLVIVAISVTTTVQDLPMIVEWRESGLAGVMLGAVFGALPYVSMWVAFTFLYLFMPNIRVRFSAAVIGGIVGGTLWQLTQLAYVHFQVGVARYNAIYGTMAVLPILMVWLYLSWVIVLLGAELTANIQNLESVCYKMRAARRPVRRHDVVGLAVLLSVVRAFLAGKTPLPVERIAHRLDLLEGQVETVADELIALNLLTRIEGNGFGAGYLPTRAPGTMTVQQVLTTLRGDLPEVRDVEGRQDWLLIRDLVTELAVAEERLLAGMTLQELAERLPESDSAAGEVNPA